MGRSNPPRKESGSRQGEGRPELMALRKTSKKESLAVEGNRTKTDTGGRDEYSKARE